MEKDRYLLSSLNNALCLLDLLSHASSLSLAELTHLSGMDKASVFRSLYTLEKNGYVQKLPEARYRFGLRRLRRVYGQGAAGREDHRVGARSAGRQGTRRRECSRRAGARPPFARQTAQNAADTDRRVRLGCTGAVGSGAGSEARVRACRHGIRADQCFPRGGGKGDRTRGRRDL